MNNVLFLFVLGDYMKNRKFFLKYILIFVILFLSLLLFGFYNNQFDSMWNYSFSYAIARGQVPYRDFNMVSTPLFSFVGALSLLISQNYIFYMMEWAVILTVMFYFLFKLLGNNAWFMLIVLLFPFLHTIVPTYNFFCIVLLVLILYLEKRKSNDWLIGFCIGLCILTKHTVGIFFLLPSLLYIREDYKKIFKRMGGLLVPCLIFFVYLIFTNSLFQFIDLCFLGLFDFSSNSSGFTVYFYLSILLVGIILFFIKKDYKDILNYYILCCFSFLLPLFDSYHFLLFFSCFMLAVLSKLNEFNKSFKVVLPLILTVCIGNFFIHDGLEVKRFNNYKNLNFYFINSNLKKIIDEMNEVFLKYNGESTLVILSTRSSFVYIGNNLDVNYFLVFLKGNYGYNGTRKLINRIDKSDNIYIINLEEFNELGDDTLYLYEVSEYVIDNYKLIDKVGDYGVYEKK